MDQKFVPQYNYISSRPPNAADKALDATLREYMAEAMPLESDEGMEKRREVLVAVEAIFRNFVKFVAVNVHHMTEEEAEDAGGELRVSGSHRLGVRDVGADIDTICVAPHFVTREHFFDYLKKDFMTHPDVSDFNAIETAVVPIMAFDFMEISIDLLFARLSSNRVPKNFDILSDSVLSDIDEATEKSLNGPRVTDMIPRLACKAKDTDGRIIEHDAFPSNAEGDNTFLVVLRCVRLWAKKRGLYGNKMGYVFCYTIALPSFLVRDELYLCLCLCLSLIHLLLPTCLHTLTPHDTSLTIIPIPQSINRHNTHISYYIHIGTSAV